MDPLSSNDFGTACIYLYIEYAILYLSGCVAALGVTAGAAGRVGEMWRHLEHIRSYHRVSDKRTQTSQIYRYNAPGYVFSTGEIKLLYTV